MAWIRVEASVRTHEKFLTAGPAACWLWLCGLAYCQEGLTDGYIPFQALEHLGVKSPNTMKSKLVAVGLWHEVAGGWEVHGYLKHNKSAETVRGIQQDRRDAGANGGRVSGVARAPKQVASTDAKQAANPSTALNGSTTAASTAQNARHTHGPTIFTPPSQFRHIAHFSACGNVPKFLHDEFLGKVLNAGVSEGEAHQQVMAFYGVVEAQYAGQVVGEEPVKFWRAQFADKAKPVKVTSAASAMVFDTLGVKP